MARVDIDQRKKVGYAHQVTDPYVRRTAELIWGGARALVPRGSGRSGSGESIYARGRRSLFHTLHVDNSATAFKAVSRVGSGQNHAATVHQGSDEHVIRSGGKVLKFRWPRGQLLIEARRSGRLRGRGRSSRLRMQGGFFFFESVRHPGNKRPVRYLTTPMHLFGRARGFKTTSLPVNRSRLP